jgi:hypothetical protein
MRSVIAPLVVAVLLALVGAAAYMTGQTETRLAEAHKRLATLQYQSAADATTAAEQNAALIGLSKRLPMTGADADTDVRDVRATTEYWRANYAALAPQRDAGGMMTEKDPELLFLAANAAFRASQTSDRIDTLRRLDTVVKTYADVLKNSPGHIDAAYNYEFAVRMRDTLGKQRPGAAKAGAARAAADGTAGGDLPAGPTLHGKPGGPPPQVNMNQFKIVIPKRGEERNDAPDAGKGGTKVRKG